MSYSASGARDRFAVAPVEGALGRDTFDGNHSNEIVSWLVPMPGRKWEDLDEDQLAQLMLWTEAGHLAWVVFPIDNL